MTDETAVPPVANTPEEPDDGLARELAKAAPRRWWNRGTVVLAGAVLLVGGFAGGTQAQKSWGPAPAAAGGAQGGTRGGAATAGGLIAGTVELVDGGTIYVQTADGDVVIVKTDAKTTVATAAKGELSDMKSGQTVTVQGAAGTDGTVTATSVTAQRK